MSTTAPIANLAGKYLTVFVAGEAYGLPVLRVREIIRRQKVTPVPQMPGHVLGVINLRGRVIPIVDLRLRFNLPAEDTERTCIVVVQIAPTGRPALTIGLMVDSVDEVVNLTADQIEPTPDFGVPMNSASLLGMAKVNGQVKTLIDLECLLGSDTSIATL